MIEKTNKSKELSTLPEATSSFNKTLIVGHKLSNTEKVYTLLKNLGMSSPSKKSPLKISEKILLSHDALHQYKAQLQLSQAWEALALKVFLKNTHQPWWGWQDANAVTLLDYWGKSHEKLSFVLVYTSPETFLKNHLKKNPLQEKELIALLEEWYQYNTLLLEFFYKNKEKTLLVNAQRVHKNQAIYYNHIEKKLGQPLSKDNLVPTKVLDSKEEEYEESESMIDLFLSMYLAQKPKLNELYTELQSVANVPLLEKDETLTFTPLNAIEELLNKEKLHKKTKKRVRKLSNKINNIEKEKEELLNQLMSTQEELEKYYLENDLTKKEKEEALQKMKQLSLEIEKQKQEVNKIKASDKEAQTTVELLKAEQKKIKQLLNIEEKNVQEKTLENEELLTQLMSVQEELEKYYLEAQSLKHKIKEKKRYYGAAERIKEQLSYRLGKKMIEESKSFFGILGLPFSLMGVHSEYKKDIQAKKGKKLPPIESYADAYEAERVKRHLSYMLGKTMIETMKGNPFGVFVLPFRLRSTYKLYKKQREV